MHHDDEAVGRVLSRREALRVLGAMGLVPLVGGDAHRLEAATGGSAGSGPMCVVRPEQTEGPYFVDVLLDRSDIRTNPPSSEITPGLPLDLTLNVSRIDDDVCTPFEGAVVDLWQCDAVGVYSGVDDPNFDTVGERWLRGYQVADAEGRVRFTTIYPGWYPGRTVHIHFKVRTSVEDDAGEFVSQLYFDDGFTDRVFTRQPYADRTGTRVRNEEDGIFRRSGGSRLILDVAGAGEGYRASFDIGVQV